MSTPHDSPTADQLIEAVREFLEGDVVSATEGRVQFHARVAARVLSIVQRELEQGAEQTERHQAGLAVLGFSDDAALASAIRSGGLDGRLTEVARFVRETVEDKVGVANPGYAGPARPAQP